jgi:hypothetical protein
VADRRASRSESLSTSWLALTAAVSFLGAIVVPAIVVLLGMALVLVGCFGGLMTRDAARSHVYGRVAVVGTVFVVAAGIVIAVALIQRWW